MALQVGCFVNAKLMAFGIDLRTFATGNMNGSINTVGAGDDTILQINEMQELVWNRPDLSNTGLE